MLNWYVTFQIKTGSWLSADTPTLLNVCVSDIERAQWKVKCYTSVHFHYSKSIVRWSPNLTRSDLIPLNIPEREFVHAFPFHNLLCFFHIELKSWKWHTLLTKFSIFKMWGNLLYISDTELNYEPLSLKPANGVHGSEAWWAFSKPPRFP